MKNEEPTGVASNPMAYREVASYALFGSDSFYWKPLRALVRAHHCLFADWELWIHHDSSMATPIGDLARSYAEAGLVKLIYVEESVQNCRSRLWRLLPLWHSEVSLCISRDIDSLPTWREWLITEQWRRSKAAVPVFNDHPLHTAPIMAGMCGFRAREFRNLVGFESWAELIALGRNLDDPDYSVPCPAFGALAQQRRVYCADQVLLFEQVWPLVEEQTMEHRISGYPQSSCTRYSYSGIEELEFSGEWNELRFGSNDLIPHMGCKRYDIDRTVAFFDTRGEKSVIRQIREAEKRSRD
jgi:hypothetical protein